MTKHPPLRDTSHRDFMVFIMVLLGIVLLGATVVSLIGG